MKDSDKDIRDLAELVADIIRRMGASYGTPRDWRQDFTRAVKIMEKAHVRIQKGKP